jgi:hypothetical protein
LTSNVSNPLHLLQGLLKSEGDLQTGGMLKKTVERQTPSNNPENINLILRVAAEKFPEWWYCTVMVGHTATLT